ncbi:hypothetical protein [Brevundimonas diminuta]|uniref:hypothetical protein n=1 Tax=Brevundimonas diminuta TaxID=293 RepID=UPI001F5A8E9A|nr:hypothetical protein [Brevundimonas diminuta]
MPFDKNVFVNCPFDPEYVDILRPLVFCILALGFEPRIAKERADGAEVRLEKIIELIEDSKFAVHDLSRLKAKKAKEYFRLNMPFELGIDYACRRYKGGEFSTKKILILEDKAHELKKALSDLAGSDFDAHNNEPAKICKIVRDWLAQSMDAPAPPPSELWGKFADFTGENYIKLQSQNYSDQDIEDQPLRELMAAMREWLRPAAP